MIATRQKKILLLALALGLGSGTSLAAPAASAVPGAVMAEGGETAFMVKSVKILGNKQHSEAEIKRLVPEASRMLVRPARLSKQLSLLNDGQVMKIASRLTPVGNREYELTLQVEEVKNDRLAVSVNNTGNDYTGNWRLGLNYFNTDITHHGDALGVAYTTSPDEHFKDVKQVALTYKAILPKAGDSMYFAYSYSDVDMGTIASFGNFNIDATGKGHTAALHYQHNFKYSHARRQMLDMGVDYKHYENGQSWQGLGQNVKNNYDITTFSVGYYDITRRQQDSYSWQAGWTTNLAGDKEDYEKVRAGADKNFQIFRLGGSYQYRTQADWLLGISVQGQYTPDKLVSSEQLGGGGVGSVRGFKERVATGDKGILANFEIYTPKVLKNSRFVLFCDTAYLVNNSPNLGEENNRSLSSVGIGYRYADEKLGLGVSLDYAKVVDDGGLTAKGARRPWTFMLTKTF